MLIDESAKEVFSEARLAQSVERLALNQVVVGSSPTVGASLLLLLLFCTDRFIPYYSVNQTNLSKLKFIENK